MYPAEQFWLTGPIDVSSVVLSPEEYDELYPYITLADDPSS